MSVLLGSTPTELNLNDSTPTIPSGKAGVKFQAGTAYPDPNGGIPVRDASAYMEPFVASGASHAPGAVPDPGATAGTTKYLCENGGWSVPSGGGGGAWDLIDKIVVTSATPSVSFTSISGSYSHLVLIHEARVDDAVNHVGLKLQFNGDTASNYAREYVQGNGTSPSASGDVSDTTFLNFGEAPGSLATAGMSGSYVTWIHNYAGTTFWKKIFSSGFYAVLDGNRGYYYTYLNGGFWKDASAITQIDITDSGGGNMVVGSTFWLYGVP